MPGILKCPMCTYLKKPCPGGAHLNALWEDGIITVEDYKRKVLKLGEENRTTQPTSSV